MTRPVRALFRAVVERVMGPHNTFTGEKSVFNTNKF